MTPKERIIEILALIKEDKTATAITVEVMVKAVNYVDAVYNMETALAADKKIPAPEIAIMDQRRALAHNALIDSIFICNRYLFTHFERVPIGGIYSADPETLSPVTNRRAVGDWAGKLVAEMFDKRR